MFLKSLAKKMYEIFYETIDFGHDLGKNNGITLRSVRDFWQVICPSHSRSHYFLTNTVFSPVYETNLVPSVLSSNWQCV